MKTWMIGVCLVAVMTVGSGAGAYAAAPAGDGEAARPWRTFFAGQVGRLLTLRSELGVTSEQRAEIRQIVEGHRSEIAGVARPLVEKRRALRAAVIAQQPDEAAIRAAASDLGGAIGDTAVLASKIKPEVYRVLTPEQQQKVESFRAESRSSAERFLEELSAGR